MSGRTWATAACHGGAFRCQVHSGLPGAAAACTGRAGSCARHGAGEASGRGLPAALRLPPCACWRHHSPRRSTSAGRPPSSQRVMPAAPGCSPCRTHGRSLPGKAGREGRRGGVSKHGAAGQRGAWALQARPAGLRAQRAGRERGSLRQPVCALVTHQAGGHDKGRLSSTAATTQQCHRKQAQQMRAAGAPPVQCMLGGIPHEPAEQRELQARVGQGAGRSAESMHPVHASCPMERGAAAVKAQRSPLQFPWAP